ncbi:hypothetical protein SAMN05660350_02607 [Geodermatophilus obscurus]|uniref:Uncharacterized protein n=1 Tax=Geodermatophilus obscurus TaxID=1861 RepID=A0A1M7U5P6_9ACTN|nr:hypothetical protein [Geodermatophilus obscurus]SHN78381.1 hypothetical protein SAMN05660350_02607 [Geodermatophilus obscurus]
MQTDAATLRVRLDVAPAADPDAVRAQVLRDLHEHLALHGARDVMVERTPDEPAVEARSGKLRQVVVLPRPGVPVLPR